MSLRPMKQNYGSVQNKIDFTKPSLTERYPQLLELLNICVEKIYDSLGDEWWFTYCKSKEEDDYMLLLSEKGYITLGINPYTIKGKPFFKLINIFVNKKYRGKGFGKKWIKEILNTFEELSWEINGEYRKFGMILKPCCLDYGEGNYIQNLSWRDGMFDRLTDERYIPFCDSLLGQIEHYENTPKKLRKKRLKKNTKRLISYYRRFGFSFYDKDNMILDFDEVNLTKN